MCLKGPERLRHTPYIEECCQFLTSRAEHPTDYSLAVTVRLQCIIDRIQETFHADQISSKHFSTPVGIHVNFYRKELEAFKSSLPPNIQQDCECSLIRSWNPQVDAYWRKPTSSSTISTPRSTFTSRPFQNRFQQITAPVHFNNLICFMDA